MADTEPGIQRQRGTLTLSAHQLGTWLLTQPDHGMYRAETTWSGDVHPTPEEVAARDDMTEEDDAVRVLVLWPVN